MIEDGRGKRALTEEARQYRLAAETQPSRSDDLFSDLAAQLRNVGSRVRKNVLEGYSTERNSLMPSPSSSRTSFLRSQSVASGQDLFRSSNDAYRDAIASGASSQLSSPKKRSCCDDEDDELTDNEQMDEDVLHDSISSKFPENRPVKPLRRRLAATQSLPVGMMRLGEQSQLDVDRQPMTEGGDDWELDTSGNSFTPMEVS